MDTINISFDWSNPSLKDNKGHTQNEWGKNRKSYYIVAYKTKWE